jgi:hypothetical protein
VSKARKLTDIVKVYAPGSEHHGQIGVIMEMRPRKIDGSIRYTVTTKHGEVYLSEGSLSTSPRSGTSSEALCSSRP